MDWCGGTGPPWVDPLAWVSSLRAGQTSCGGRPLALEHQPVGLADVAVPGDGGGLVKVQLLLLGLLISSH